MLVRGGVWAVGVAVADPFLGEAVASGQNIVVGTPVDTYQRANKTFYKVFFFRGDFNVESRDQYSVPLFQDRYVLSRRQKKLKTLSIS